MAALKLLLGINGFSYGYFMRCTMPATVNLFNTHPRGVVYNENCHDIKSVWRRIMHYNDGFDIPDKIKNRLSIINIPIDNPTIGDYSSYFNEDYNVEIRNVFNKINNAETDYTIASVNSLNIPGGTDVKCDIYSMIDNYLYEIINKFNDFIIFSPYGDVIGDKIEPYGVYISTRPRPNPHKTIKIDEIMDIFLNI
ncbi:hypothetical protein [Picrophilus oshimae]|uniref:Uncharacterized protein n=1 Tax=Picrophilus torridus (strain ATCC 700027 / DSM 9790 / JCM 10055 / NBRC 100828 / KAW 2/3) TaxID=1122961 RepID=A0A8G2FXV9_PICTO|nr:hypothetical protein [Picrophilus oshimae]SMD31494.1 hypothetical protein SAMN02745355_1439 [Picrophilus oshimae DSM 9789]